MAPLLDIRSLHVRFPGPDGMTEVVKGIDLQIGEGEILGLIGESGSGKSVASQAICRLQQQARVSGQCLLSLGKERVDTLKIGGHALNAIRRTAVSYIFQEPMTALNPLIRCGHQIRESLPDRRKDPKAQVRSLLTKVELHDPERAYDAYPHELSGGQRQRIMIAMALAKAPRLLIADEPTTALDIAVQGELLGLLRKLARSEGLAVLFITHDLLSLQGFADRIAVMYQGKIMETGTSDTILMHPSHPYTKGLLESRASYAKRGHYLAEMGQLIHQNGDELRFSAPELRTLEEAHDRDPEVILSASGLRKWHESGSWLNRKRTVVLHGVDLELRQGDSLGIVGESGSGKSTIARILLRLWKANGGTLEVYGKPIASVEHFEQQVQMVFQDPYSSLNPKHRIGRAILEVLRTVKPDSGAAQVDALLETVGLSASDRLKYPHEFSGGQRQRICIAKALAKEPRILVLDEAVAALDVSVQARILNLLNDLKVKNRLTYVLISHDMNVVSYFCNKILVIRSGQVVEYGATEQLVKNAQDPYTRSLLQHSIL